MKRSEINNAVKVAANCFERNGWALPPQPKWDVTDFGLGDFNNAGLLLINLCEEEEYCEKLMFAKKGQETPLHYHKIKKEDIICRTGILVLHFWNIIDDKMNTEKPFSLKKNGAYIDVQPSEKITLLAGERITIPPLVWHKFYPESEECIIGEVSTANDDQHDNFFDNPKIGRYAAIMEDEPPLVKLLSDKNE